MYMEAEDVIFGYPELEWLKDDEVFIEKVHIVKGIERHKLMIKQTVKKSEVGAVEGILKKEHDADGIYLTTIEK
jgi:hypothetical protein